MSKALAYLVVFGGAAALAVGFISVAVWVIVYAATSAINAAGGLC